MVSVNGMEMTGKTWPEITRNLLERMSNVTEIEANGTTSLFYKQNGKRKEIPNVFLSEEDYDKKLLDLIDMVKSEEEKIINPNNKFLVEGRLKLDTGETARVHIVMPPASDNGQVTIAKKSNALATLEEIQAKGSMSTKMLDYIKAAVDCNMTIVISGGTGAGKALHKDTKIPTPKGWTTMGEIKEGDAIFDENGNPTKVELKYCPNDPVSYKITFDNGQQLKTSAGHLWEVIETIDGSSTRKVISTDEIHKKGIEYYEIRKLSKPVRYNELVDKTSPLSTPEEIANQLVRLINTGVAIHPSYLINKPEVMKKALRILIEKNGSVTSGEVSLQINKESVHVFSEVLNALAIDFTISNEYVLNFNEVPLTKGTTMAPLKSIRFKNVEIIDDNPEDYFCLQVDSPSHLFLCTESFVPTHNTTILEAMTKLFKDTERIAVVEDLPELKLIQPNVTYTHSTLWTPGKDKNSVATLQWCVAQVNRARADKIIIGETRGGEFSEFIMAANSGKEGSLTTIHANNARAALQKMSQLMIIGQPQPVRLANESIANSVHLIIQLGFSPKGENRVLEIVEVSRTLGTSESAAIATTPIFTYDKETDSWIDNGYVSEDTRVLFEQNGYDIATYRKKLDFNSSKMSQLMNSGVAGKKWGGFKQ